MRWLGSESRLQRRDEKKAGTEGDRDVVAVAVGKGMGQRRGCRHAGTCRGTLRCGKLRVDPVNVLIHDELRKLTEKHRRYGAPGMKELTRRQGYRVSHKRIERLWRLEGRPLSKKRPRKRKRTDASKHNARVTERNEVWGCDFIHDRTNTRATKRNEVWGCDFIHDRTEYAGDETQRGVGL